MPYTPAFNDTTDTMSGAMSRSRLLSALLWRATSSAARATPGPARTSARFIARVRSGSGSTSTDAPGAESRCSIGPRSARITVASTPSAVSTKRSTSSSAPETRAE